MTSQSTSPNAAATENPAQEQGLWPALRRLDALLSHAITTARSAYDANIGDDAFRGLYIAGDEIDRLLRQAPGTPILNPNAPEEDHIGPWQAETTGEDHFSWLQSAFGLSAFELDIVLIALAPEIDLKYERIYAYLQDDVSRKRPSVDLVLNILCSSPEQKLIDRSHFMPDAPLIRHGLLHLDDDPQVAAYELARPIQLDEQVVHLLLDHDHLDRRLMPYCRFLQPNWSDRPVSIGPGTYDSLSDSVREAKRYGRPAHLHLFGLFEQDRLAVAQALAATVNMPLLVADVSDLGKVPDAPETVRIIFREAWFRGAMLYLRGFDGGGSQNVTPISRAVAEVLRDDGGITLLSSTSERLPEAFQSMGVVPVPLAIPDADQRRMLWQTTLADQGLDVPASEVAALAASFRLAPSQIDNAVASAAARVGLRKVDIQNGYVAHAVFAAARAQTGQELATVTNRLEPTSTWDDIVLPDDTVAQLREICNRVRYRDRVLGQWGFGRKLSRGKGVAALFAGGSGTGKTMAAEVIADDLRLDLYRIDLSGVVSKYIGETEKNLDRIFHAAETANAILFFDEADALFGKRSEVRDSHDRYANIEISYLLQRMEEYDGITILATNLRQNLDDAFVRRLAFTVPFPFPNDDDRRRIWSGVWPLETPLANDVDLDALAQGFKLSGGNIKNIALAASYMAATEDGPVGLSHILHAIRREYQKMGKMLSDEELNRAIGERS